MGIEFSQIRSERMPAADDGRHNYQIRRASHEKPTCYVCVSSDFIGVRTHFYHRRTTPCLKLGCPACQEHYLSRWHGYILTLDTVTHERICFEFSAGGAEVLDSARKEFGTLRGFKFIASRAQKKVNGRVVLTGQGMTTHLAKLPSEEDIWTILAQLWGFTFDAPAATSIEKHKGITPADRTEAAPKRTMPPRINGEPQSMSELLGRALGHGLNGETKIEF